MRRRGREKQSEWRGKASRFTRARGLVLIAGQKIRAFKALVWWEPGIDAVCLQDANRSQDQEGIRIKQPFCDASRGPKEGNEGRYKTDGVVMLLETKEDEVVV